MSMDGFCIAAISKIAEEPARETIKSFRKDVTVKLHAADLSRKSKLLQKQKRGKKRMKQIGRINLPQEAFLTLMR